MSEGLTIEDIYKEDFIKRVTVESEGMYGGEGLPEDPSLVKRQELIKKYKKIIQKFTETHPDIDREETIRFALDRVNFKRTQSAAWKIKEQLDLIEDCLVAILDEEKSQER